MQVVALAPRGVPGSSRVGIVGAGNFGAAGGDSLGVRCSRIRGAISADLDGEDLPVARDELTRHLSHCPACREYQASASALQRRTRVRAAPAVPDLTRQVLAAIGAEPRPAPAAQGLRLGVGVIGVLQLGLSLPALLFGSDAGLPVHTARHLGSFGVALAVGFLVAAWRPQRIAGLLPLATALVVCLVGSSILDVTTGHASPSGELSHAAEVLGLLGLWLLARSATSTPTDLQPA
jgi:predicted anti-sigma-YlaC factor YlaD